MRISHDRSGTLSYHPLFPPTVYTKAGCCPILRWEVAKQVARWVEVDYQDGHGSSEDDAEDESEQGNENDID